MGAPIQINGVSHRFSPKGQPVLSDLQLDITAGESVSLIGESGCGKSTLLHMLAGLLMPSDGAIRIRGKQVTRPNPEWNMMFQRPGLYPWLTVEQNVALGLQFTGQTGGLKGRVKEMLEVVGLLDRGRSRVQDLSGGQQQRVALARSLAVEPQVILLDEPFSALDAFTRRNLQLEVSEIARDRDITLVLVTHDVDEALAMGQKVVVMGSNPGRFHSVLDIDHPFPRNLMSTEMVATREELMNRFRDSVKTESQREDAPTNTQPFGYTREQTNVG